MPYGPSQKGVTDPCPKVCQPISEHPEAPLHSPTTSPLGFRAEGGSLWGGMWPARHWCQSAGPRARHQQEPTDQPFTDAKQPLSSCCRRHYIPHHVFKDALGPASCPSGCPCSAFCPRSSSSSLSGPPRWLKLHPGLNHRLHPPAAHTHHSRGSGLGLSPQLPPASPPTASNPLPFSLFPGPGRPGCLPSL